MLGHEAHVAADGATGLDLLERGTYDLVITDVVMPGMSGVAFAGDAAAVPGRSADRHQRVGGPL